MATEPIAIVELQQKFEKDIQPKGELARLEIIVNELEIDAKPQLDTASEILGDLKNARRIVEDFWEPLRASAYDSYSRIQEQKKFFMAPFDKLIDTLTAKMKTYVLAEKRREQEEAARLQREAEAVRKLAEEKRQRLLKRGEIEQAQMVQEAASLPVPEPPKSDLKMAETTIRGTFKPKVTDLKALAAAMAAGTVPEQAIEANMVFLNKMTKALGKQLNYPGVEVYEDVGFANKR